jgi:CHAT domain-containing protein/Tfp pilus assembly protein PilF
VKHRPLGAAPRAVFVRAIVAAAIGLAGVPGAAHATPAAHAPAAPAAEDPAALEAEAAALIDAARHEAALARADRAVALRRAASASRPAGGGGDEPDAAIALSMALVRRAEALLGLGRHDDAVQGLAEALELQQARLGERHALLVGTLRARGWALLSGERLAEAGAMFDRAQLVAAEAFAGPHPALAALFNDHAVWFERQAAYERALPLAEAALSMREALLGPSAGPVGQSLNNLALLHESLGQDTRARELLERSLAVNAAAYGPRHPEIAAVAHNLGGVLADSGRYLEALDRFEQAVAIDAEVGGPEHPSVAMGLGGVGAMQRALGRLRDALATQRRALAIFERAGAASEQARSITLTHIGGLLTALGDPAAAEAPLVEALRSKRARLVPDHPSIAVSLLALAAAREAAGRADEAAALREEARAMRARRLGAEHPDVAAVVVAARGRVPGETPDATAGDALRRAERIAVAHARPDTAWRAQQALAELAADAGAREAAIFWGTLAVQGIDALRRGLARLPASQQRSFLVHKRPVFLALAERLLEAGRADEALAVLALWKREELHDFTGADRAVGGTGGAHPAAPPPIAFAAGAAASAAAERERLAARLRALVEERARLQRWTTLGLEPGQQARLEGVEAELAAATADYDRFAAGLAARLAAAPAGGAAPAPASLPKHTASLSYLLLRERIVVVLRRPGAATRAVWLEGRPATLLAEVQALREAIQRRTDAKPAAQALWRRLLAPVAPELQRAGVRTVHLSLDGALRYLPFAALHDGRRWAAERHAFVMATDAVAAAPARAPPPRRAWTMAGLGLTRAVEGFEPLPAVKAELEGIRANALPGEVWLDESFTRERLAAALAAPPPVVHIASHFEFRPGTEAESFLVLGDGSRLTLAAFRQQRARLEALDLLTLSACDTAMGGGADENGVEVESFAALARAQGARAVLATLWPVADGSTGRLMRRLYALRAKGGAGTAEALRRAQVAFIGSAPARDAHPFHWAPFVLMGDAR